MFHIVEQNQLYGVVYLPEKELSRVHKDQAATLTLSALQDSKVDAFVERISPVIDPATGTFKVTLRVPNDEHLLKAGMFAHVDLNYDTHQQATLMPRKAMLGHQNLKDQAPVEIVNPEALLLQAQSHEQAISNTPQQNEDNASLDANHTS